MRNTRMLVATVLLFLSFTVPGSPGDEKLAPTTRGNPPLSVDQPAGVVLADGRGQPWIGLRDGRPLSSGSERSADPGEWVGTALAAADIDGDGLSDLVVAYSGAETGRLALHRANLDARAPTAADARQRKTAGTFDDTPLLPGEPLADIPVSADLLRAGDLDGDGRDDLIFARSGRAEMWWLPARAAGEPGVARRIPLRGAITSLATGDADRGDGRDDVVVGTVSADRAELSLLRLSDVDDGAGLFEESVLLAGEAPFDSVALGALDRDKAIDLAAAAGRELTLLLGDASGRFAEGVAHRETFDHEIRSLTFGDFKHRSQHGPAVAVLLRHGRLRLLRSAEESWDGRIRVDVLENTPFSARQAEEVVALSLSNQPGDDLLLRDALGHRLWVRVGGGRPTEWVQLDATASPRGVLPLQLNADPFEDIVVMIDGAPAPTLMVTAAAQIHAVDSTGDDGDLSTADGICATASGDCTLRAALEQANATPATDAIRFDILGVGPHTIQPLSPLPAIVAPLLLDATTEPEYAGTPVIELDGSLAGETDGLVLLAGSSSIRGLAINRFAWSGLALVDPEAVDDRIQANYIGTDVTGAEARANLGSGIYIGGGARNTVVGTDGDGVADAEEGNLLSGNVANGVAIGGAGTDDNVVAGNRIGTNAGGSAAIGNGEFGVSVYAYARNNIVGTNGDGLADLAERNLLSGNGVRGVLFAFESEHNVIAGNFIGTDVTGLSALPNEGGGIELSNGTRFNRVGTDADGLADEEERNVISGNEQTGIVLFGEPLVVGTTIAGNYIGVDAGGGGALSNSGDGISASDITDTLIGGFLPTMRNVISGNGGNGVSVGGPLATGTRVQGNYIGTDATGFVALGNGLDGVVFGNTPGNVIGTDGDGGFDDAEGNVVSANTNNGITLFGAGAVDNVIAGNLVGTVADGSSALGNGQVGAVIVDRASVNVIGTDGDGLSDVEERNVISGNLVRGVLIAADAERNVVAGNHIGTDVTGTVAVPNLAGGIELSNGARFNRVGTDDDGQSDTLERNVISGNVAAGIMLFGTPSSDENVIAGNFIGLQIDGVTALGNTTYGIVMNADANRNLVGGFGVTPGTCDGPCNHIGFNGTGQSLDGVRIVAGIENAVVGNVIHDSTGGAGIDIAGAGATPNDPGDVDGGSNNGQNFPLLTGAVTVGDTTTIEGMLDSIPNTSFHLEFFANSACDGSGFGEGESLVAMHRVTTDSGGQSTFSVPVTPAVPEGHRVCSTATRLGPGDVPTDTSEFSACISLGPLAAAGRVPDGHFQPGALLQADRGAGPTVILTWEASCLGTDVDYAVYSGTLGDFTSHRPQKCSTSGLTTTTVRINEDRVYLFVVPLSGNREGSYGFDGDGFERPIGTSVCHERMIGACP